MVALEISTSKTALLLEHGDKQKIWQERALIGFGPNPYFPHTYNPNPCYTAQDALQHYDPGAAERKFHVRCASSASSRVDACCGKHPHAVEDIEAGKRQE